MEHSREYPCRSFGRRDEEEEMNRRQRTRQLRHRAGMAAGSVAVALVATLTAPAIMRTRGYSVAAETVAETTAEAMRELPVIVIETETEPEQETEPAVNQEDVDLLARLIEAEQGIVKDDEALYSCGSVVLNRVKSSEYPNTLYDVIYQTKPCLQYACTKNKTINRPASERSLRIAEELLKYGSTAPEDVVYQAEFKQGSGVWKHIGNTYFCHR